MDLATQLGDFAIQTWPASEMPFDWIPTVQGYGLQRLHAASGEPRFQDWYRSWVLEHAGPYADPMNPVLPISSDSLSPALLASVLLQEDPSAVQAQPIVDAALSYLATARRTSEGAIVHWGPEHIFFGNTTQVWVDSMFMFGMFLLWENHRGTDGVLDLFLEQYQAFSKHCRTEDELYLHAWDEEAGVNIPSDATYWARGNAWVLEAGAAALLNVDPAHPGMDKLLEDFQSHALAILELQAEDGLWYTVLNRGDDDANYTETSASALIAHALLLGTQAGALSQEETLFPIASAVQGLRRRITTNSEGQLQIEGTSFATNPGDYASYLAVPQVDNSAVGVGTLMMLLSDVDGTPRPKE